MGADYVTNKPWNMKPFFFGHPYNYQRQIISQSWSLSWVMWMLFQWFFFLLRMCKEPESRRKHITGLKNVSRYSLYRTISARVTRKPSSCEILKGSTEKLPLATSVPPRSKPLLKNRIPWPKYLEVHTCSRDDRRIIERLRINPVQKADAAHFHTEKKLGNGWACGHDYAPWSSHPLHYLETFWLNLIPFFDEHAMSLQWSKKPFWIPNACFFHSRFGTVLENHSLNFKTCTFLISTLSDHLDKVMGSTTTLRSNSFFAAKRQEAEICDSMDPSISFLEKTYQSHWLPVAF